MAPHVAILVADSQLVGTVGWRGDSDVAATAVGT